MKKTILLIAALFVAFVANVNADTVLSNFEGGMTSPTYFVDEWEDSPFNNAICTNTTVEVIANPYKNELDSTSKVLHYVRPYYSGDRNGVEIKLENSFNITSKYQYLHVMVYKPVSSRLVLAAIDNVNNVKQCIALCSTDSRANAWSDAVFAVRSSGSTIDRIRIYPDCETAVGRLTGDIDIYIDEIVLSDSSEPRAASTFCSTSGTLSAKRYLSFLQTQDGLVNTTVHYKEAAKKVQNYISNTGMVAEKGAPFTLTFAQKATSGTNTAWVTDVYADFNCDREYVSGNEYLGRVNGVKQGDSILYTVKVNVPSTATVGAGSIRLKFTDASDAAIAGGAHAPCEDVKDGLVYDFSMDIKEALERPTLKIEGLSSQSGWGSIGFDGHDGTEIKVVYGTAITCVAQPSVGHKFVMWCNKETGSPISDEATFTFPVLCNMTLVAKFAEVAYCKPEGTTPSYYAGKIAITPQGATALYYLGNATTAVDEVGESYVSKSIMGGVNVRRGTTFALDVTKAVSSASFTNAKMGVWVDWNLDHQFAEDEFVTATVGADTKQFNIAVPNTAVNGETRIRLCIAEGTITGADACADLGNGITYDLDIRVAPNTSEKFSLTATPSIAGAATYSLNKTVDGTGKLAAGTDVEITCVPAAGYKFVQWKKDGVPYGATMTSNNPLPITGLSEDLALTMEMEAEYPTYCEATAPNNSAGNHYGISSGAVYVNRELAFHFSNGGETLVDLSESSIINVVAGDTIRMILTGGQHTQWGDGYAYIDWNRDGTWSTTGNEITKLYSNPGAQVSEKEYKIIVPTTVVPGTCGMRMNTGEAYTYNKNTYGPCITLTKGIMYTFSVCVSEEPFADVTTVKATCNTALGQVAISGTSKNTLITSVGATVTVTATPGEDCEFVSWTKNGAVVSTDPSYTFVVEESVELVANFSSSMITYCTGSANTGTASFFLNAITLSSPVNNFTVNTTACLNNLQESNIIQARNGETIRVTFSSNSTNTKWGNVVMYADWNRNGVFETDTDEKFDVFGGTDGTDQSGAQYSNVTYDIVVPWTATSGLSALRIISEEAIKHNSTSNNFDPCGTRHKGSVHTFGLKVIDPTVDVPTIEATINNEVRVYPNPVVDKVHVETAPLATIRVMTINGTVVVNEVAQKSITEIDMQRLPSGIYLLQVVDEVGVKTLTLSKR